MEIIHVLVIVSLDSMLDSPIEFLIVDLNSEIDESVRGRRPTFSFGVRRICRIASSLRVFTFGSACHVMASSKIYPSVAGFSEETQSTLDLLSRWISSARIEYGDEEEPAPQASSFVVARRLEHCS